MKKDSVVLVWASGKTISDILFLLNSWGYEYVNILLTWVKTDSKGNCKLGLGYWTRNNSEFLLMARKGKTQHFRNTSRNIP